jgi:hypothetical protein
MLAPRAGDTVSLTIRAKRRPEATGEITLQLRNLPDGVTVEPAKLAPGATEAHLTLKVDADASAAAIDLVTTGETKVGDATVTAISPAFSLSVTEVPGFTFAVEPKEMSITHGSKEETSFTAKVQRRGGFDGPIDLEWALPAPQSAFPAGKIEAGKSEGKLAFKLPPALSPGSIAARLIARATVAGETRTRETGVKLTVTPTPAGGK